MTTHQAIDEMVRRIIRNFDPEKIILFGSYARGCAGPHSDVDILVVMPVAGSRRKKRIEVRLALCDIQVAKDILVFTPEELESNREIPGTLAREVARDGKIVYERTH